MAYVWFKVSDLITPIRVSRETEIEGLDAPGMGVLGYPDFQLHPSGVGIYYSRRGRQFYNRRVAREQSAIRTELSQLNSNTRSEGNAFVTL